MATPTALSGAAYTLKVNGRDLHELGVVEYQLPSLGVGPIDVQQIVFPERHEAYSFQATYQPEPFVVTGKILADSAAELRANLDLLKGLLRPLRGSLFSTPTAIRVELADHTDRYWPCAFPGGLSVIPDGTKPTGGRLASFTLPLLQLTPFAIATQATGVSPSGTGPSFTVLEAGTAPCPALIELEGAATAPDLVLTNTGFYWNANYSMDADGIDGSTITGSCGLGTKSDAFEPGDYGKGAYIQLDTFTTSWSSVISNPDEGTVILVIRPQFASDASPNAEWFLDWYIDADNGIRIVFQGSDDRLYLTRERAAAVASAGGSGAAQTFSADDPMVVVGSWGADGLKVYRDGTLLDSNAGVTTGVVGSSGTLYLGDQAGANRANVGYEYVMLLPFQLSDAQVKEISARPEEWRPTSVKKSKAGDLIANERSVLDFARMTAIKVATDLTQTNDLSDWDTRGWPLLGPPAMCLHVPAGESIAGIKVRYRKRWM